LGVAVAIGFAGVATGTTALGAVGPDPLLQPTIPLRTLAATSTLNRFIAASFVFERVKTQHLKD
jgi:hypothetical protein